MRNSLKLVALGIALCASPVLAQQASEGNWMVRGRAVSLDFDNGQSSGLPLGGTTKIEADDRWIPEVDITYFFTRNIAAELVLTYPQKIDIKVGGSKQGTIKALPPSLLLQYHLPTGARSSLTSVPGSTTPASPSATISSAVPRRSIRIVSAGRRRSGSTICYPRTGRSTSMSSTCGWIPM